MLTIRSEQMQAFKDSAWQRFEKEMVSHIEGFAPKLCKVNGDSQTRLAVHQSIEQARTYGFTNRGSVRLFVELTYLFGSGFDTDPQYFAISTALHESGDQMRRAQQMYQHVIEYQEAVCGPENAFVRSSLEYLSLYARQPIKVRRQEFGEQMLDELHRVYPQKASYVGDNALMSLIDETRAKAQQIGFSTVRAYTMLLALMFAFGHSCTDDPLYPWISRTLKDYRIPDSNARAERLEKKAITWLDHVLAESGQGVSR